MRSASLTAAGELRLNGERLISLPEGLLLDYDRGMLKLRMYYQASGQEITAVRLNGQELVRQDDDLSPYFEAEGVTLPLRIEADYRERVRAHGTFVQRQALGKGDSGVSSARMAFLARPDELSLVFEATAPEGVSLRLDTYRYSKSSAWQLAETRALQLRPGPTRVALSSGVGPTELVQYRLAAVDAQGQPVAVPLRAELTAVYRDRPVPALSYPEKGLITVRLLYPYAYELCALDSLEARTFSRGVWRPVNVYVGENGQHVNRFYRSEYTTYVSA